MAINRSRQHHFVSQFHLAYFTDTGLKDGNLYIHDLVTKSTRNGKPESVAYRNYYNSQQAEKSFNDFFESPINNVIKEILTTKKFPSNDEDWAKILKFILFQAYRVPIIRDFHERINSKLVIDKVKFLALNDPPSLPNFMEKLEKENVEIHPKSDFVDDSLEIVDWNKLKVTFPTQWHIDNLLEIIEGKLVSIAYMNWKMYVSKADSDDFICTDKPVICLPKHPSKYVNMQRWIVPDFNEDTVVLFPLTRRIALVGEFNDEEYGKVIEADNDFIARFNGLLLMYPAYIKFKKEGDPVIRNIYSAKDNFVYSKIDSTVGNKEDFFADL